MINLYHEFIQVSDQFINLVEKETQFLQSHQLKKALELLPEKRDLANLHAKKIEEISSNNRWETYSPEDLKTLQNILDRLKEVLIRNEQTISLIHTIQEGILNKITDALHQEMAPVFRYSKDRRKEINTAPISLSAINKHV